MSKPKTESQLQFDKLVSEVIWPEFKQRGYHRAGNNFRYYDAAGWGKILNIQKSVFGDRNSISFTLNTGLYLPEAERLWMGRTSDERFLEPGCLIRKRIGRLKSSHNQWYELLEPSEFDQVLHSVEQDMSSYVLPYMDRVTGIDDILEQLILEKEPSSALAIETLFVYGRRQEAQTWMEHELANTIYRARRQELLELQNKLNNDLYN
ncbi:DUF4304 domain-containing protein [Hymenobacter glacieicola]|uniref:DUF4304 domain-containing protein n=1 Tax=Hymenobacter glacieicola TaxID=1562124 RepID=A0ABQ1WYM6_9BACT|nr:DUF4304 domain-containing protein [Hymenobacter glacieicola]GGG49625.1 hypothetical protein GCM10011378_27190 [Hymenobacter glacieicola]